MPAGNVEVKFYDYNKSGEETLPNCIIDIGDVEEGFDYNFGEYNAPTCDFKLWNKNNIIKNMLNTNELKVSVNIDDENYFYGFVNIPSAKPTDNFFYEYSFNTFGALSALQRYNLVDFYNRFLEFNSGPEGFNKLDTIFMIMAEYLDIHNIYEDKIEYFCKRKYSRYSTEYGGWVEWLLKDLLFEKDIWFNETYQNRYDDRIENAYQLLNELKNDFFLYPSIVYNGAKHELKLIEKDAKPDLLAVPTVKKRSKELNYFMSQFIVDLLNRPEHMETSGLRFDTGFNGNHYGDVVEHFMAHTNVIKTVEATEDNEAFTTNMRFKMQHDPRFTPGSATNVTRISNYSNGSYTDYDGLQEAIYNAIKEIYFNNVNWERLTVKGLKGTQNNVSKLEYLMPAYRFNYDNSEYYIHSVNKSLKRNESEVLGLVSR